MEAWFGLIGFVVGSIITIIIFRIERKDRLKLSHQERKDKFKLVAIEKRLEAHQQALKHWNELREIIHEKDSNRNKVIWAATDFWYNNCLYLEKGTREKFKDVIFLVSNYPIFWQAWRDAEPGKDKEKQSKDLKGYWDDIHSLPQLIMSEVELESISINEDKDAFGNLEDK